jgi:hypothetical protein
MKTREELLNEMDKFRRTLTSGQSKVLKSGLHQILSAPTEEQMKFGFCHAPLSGREWSKLEYCNELRKHSNLCGDVLIYVNFCQFCGRKLGDE